MTGNDCNQSLRMHFTLGIKYHEGNDNPALGQFSELMLLWCQGFTWVDSRIKTWLTRKRVLARFRQTFWATNLAGTIIWSHPGRESIRHQVKLSSLIKSWITRVLLFALKNKRRMISTARQTPSMYWNSMFVLLFLAYFPFTFVSLHHFFKESL